ncbi:MAG: sulfatase-like hydrolase/transferase, partial [Negativicutes bacterium]|nr:sulfatase-like hydrolase/transferase [Negativicutes bacterium]
RIEDFVRAQGFQDFHGRGDITASSGNIWGCDDRDLFDFVLGHADLERPGLHVILTVSNHLPFSVDLAKAGFDRSVVAGGLDDEQLKDEGLLTALGHYWYADRTMNDFIAAMREKAPQSLFVVVGDHANRLNLEAQPDMFRQYAVPLIISGPGIDRQRWPARTAGSHIDLAATIIDLVAPAGWPYHSLGNSLASGNRFAVNYGWWMDAGMMGVTHSREWLALPDHLPGQTPDFAAIDSRTDAVRAMSYWRIRHGQFLKEN